MEAVEQNDLITLIQSVQNEDSQTLEFLLNKGQNQGTLNSGLCWAARLGSLPLVTMLLDRGADPNAEILDGYTPLMWTALFSGNTDVVNCLISYGADVNRCTKKRKQTALHAAVIKGNPELVDCLIHGGAFLDPQDYLYKTPLLHAVQRNLLDCIKLLILNNCDVNLSGFCNGNRLSPLLVALLQSNFEATKMLVLAGARFERMAIYQTYTVGQYYRTVEDNLNMELRPVYLKQQCRICIRQLLKPQFFEKLKEIELPPLLREFLSMEELQRIDQ